MNSSKHVETTANVATIVVAILLSVVLVKQFLLPAPRRGRTSVPQAVAGTSLTKSLPGVDWKKNGRTLILAISTQCHFCTESAPFFQRIGREAGKDVKLVAVLPQPNPEAQQYLNTEGVRVDDVKRATLAALGVTGTPTLLLVNDSGTVTNVWEGKLPPDKEEEVLGVLKGRRSAGT